MAGIASQPSIAFIGLGNMGAPMAGHLCARGFGLTVCDADAAACARFAASHRARVAPTAREAMAGADIVLLMLPNGRIVREVLSEGTGTEHSPPALRPGSVVVDMSSSAPTGTQQLGALLGKRGVRLIDAPVSGGVARARDASLAMMAGGEAATVAAMRPILATMASSIVHVGPLGAGHAMKALNNYVSAAGLLAACEAVRTAQEFGIDGELAVQVLNSSTGRNNSTEKKLSQFVLSDRFNSGFSLGLMRKDLETALLLSRDLGMELPLADGLVTIWADAEKTLGPGADHTEIARAVRKIG